ncbi:MAG: RibD family protein [Rubrobacteraceae bacterium]
MTVSYAQTLDGRLATVGGSSRWISAPDSLRFAHELRAEHDAVIVGAGTVSRDNPRLTVRHVKGPNPIRIVVDSSLKTPLSAAVLSNGAARGTVLAVTEKAPEDRRREASALGAKVLRLPEDPEGKVDLEAFFEELYGIGVRSAMVEGGATLITALLRKRLADRLAVCVAPKILGLGIEAIGDLGIRDLDLCVALKDFTVKRYGPDVVLEGGLEYCDG